MVELAVCLPLLTLLVLATIECCAMIFLQQSLTVAAYEGARVALAPEADTKNVEYQVELILADRDVRDATVSVAPRNVRGAAAGAWVRVMATAPFSENCLVGGWLFGDKTLTASATMMKER